MKRVAIYARVSTQEQGRKGVSIETQLENLKAWAQDNGYEVVPREYVDRGYSGTTNKRPGLNRLMLDARDHRFDVVAVSKLDRFMRNTKLLLQTLEELESCHCAFVPLDLPACDTSTSVGKLFLHLVGIFAEFESGRIGERVKETRATMRGKGLWGSGASPYGYRWDKKSKKFNVVGTEAMVVRKVFDLYVNHSKGLEAIAEILNSEGLRTKRNKHFCISMVHSIIKNPQYIGEDKHYQFEPLISKELFKNAQVKRSNAKRFQSNAGHYELQGRVNCGLCGHKLGGRHKRADEKRVYRCNGREKRTHLDGTPRCTLRDVHADWIEEEVQDATDGCYRSPEVLAKHVQARIDQFESELRQMSETIAPIQERINDLKNTMGRAGDRYEQGNLPKAEFDQKMKDYKKQVSALERQSLNIDPDTQYKYEELSGRIESYKKNYNYEGMLNLRDWFDSDNVQGLLNWTPVHGGTKFREFLDKFQIQVWAFPDKLEVRGLIPTQTVQHVFDKC